MINVKKSRKPSGADVRRTTSAVLPVARFAHGGFQLKTGYWVGLIGVHGIAWDLQSDDDRIGVAHRYHQWLLQPHPPWQIIVEATPPDFTSDIARYRERARAWRAHHQTGHGRGADVLAEISDLFAEWLTYWPTPRGETVRLWMAVTTPSYADSVRQARAMQTSLATVDPALAPWIPSATEIIEAWARWADRPNPWIAQERSR